MNKDTIELIGVIVVILLIATIAFVIGVRKGVDNSRKAAIQAGEAHYTVNPTNGITQFEFKAQKP